MPSVLDMPVEGEIILGLESVDQKPIEELAPAINDVLEDPMIEAVRWRQYTPYFNDGDPCVFTIHEFYFRLAGDDNEVGDYEDGFISTYDIIFQEKVGKIKHNLQHQNDHYIWTYDVVGEAPSPELAEACVILLDAVGSRAFNNALYKAYGDHAIVTVDPGVGKVIVDFYEHE